MSTRSKVLAAFKKLHNTRHKIFKDDERALSVVREKINTEFRKHQNETDQDKINEMLNIAIDAEKILSKNVVQGEINKKEDDSTMIKLRVRNEVLGFNNPLEFDKKEWHKKWKGTRTEKSSDNPS